MVSSPYSVFIRMSDSFPLPTCYYCRLKSVNKGKPPSKQISPRANRNNSNSSNNGGGFNNSSSNEGLNDNNHSGDRLRNADGYNANQPNGSNYRNDNRNDFNNRNDGRFNGNNSRDMNDCNDGSSTSRHHHANGNNSQDEVNRFNGKFQESSPSRIPRNRNRDEFEDNQEHYPPQVRVGFTSILSHSYAMWIMYVTSYA